MPFIFLSFFFTLSVVAAERERNYAEERIGEDGRQEAVGVDVDCPEGLVGNVQHDIQDDSHEDAVQQLGEHADLVQVEPSVEEAAAGGKGSASSEDEVGAEERVLTMRAGRPRRGHQWKENGRIATENKNK